MEDILLYELSNADKKLLVLGKSKKIKQLKISIIKIKMKQLI